MTTVALMGDSQAGGIQSPLGEALRNRGWTTLGAGHINGASTRRLIDDGVLTRALALRPNVLVVFSGGNDTSRSATVWNELVDRARLANVRVVWVGPPAAVGDAALDAERLAISRAQQVAFATKPHVKWIDGRASAAGLPRRDEVHLTMPEGYLAWANRLAPQIAGAAAGSVGLVTFGIAGAVLWGAWKAAQAASGSRRPVRRGRRR